MPVLIGVDVGGTFTDLAAWDGDALCIVKLPSTPPRFERAVIDAVNRALVPEQTVQLIHGSTVATNALLQRAGEPVAFITTQGFGDMLLIGRQNRPSLYALHVQRPAPITPETNWFTIPERIDRHGQVIEPLDQRDIAPLVSRIAGQGLRHAAVCLLFSFANPAHERMIAQACASAGISVSLSSDLMPEFREYERASTTAINASLRPVVAAYLQSLEAGLPQAVKQLRIMHSGGGTLNVAEASQQACKLVLSGPAGGVIGAAHIAQQAGCSDLVTYDMGGTSTDVALILGGQPQWTTSSTIDGLPIGLPMFDIHTVGAGGGSIARVDAGGALRVGPRSAGAVPGPACYGRGGTEPTVTDANLVLGRILPGRFLGGAMKLDVEAAQHAVGALAGALDMTITQAALGIVKVAESNMAHAIRAVSSRRGHDPRHFALVSFGGAGGLHACALADGLEMKRVLVPAYCGVLSALGMIVASPVADAARSVIQLGAMLDDDRLAAEFGSISELTMRQISSDQTASVEAYADVRFAGQSHELKVRVMRPARAAIEQAFLAEYERVYGRALRDRAVEIVTLRVRRVGRAAQVRLPQIPPSPQRAPMVVPLTAADGRTVDALAVERAQLVQRPPQRGPLLVVDAEATTYVPPEWSVSASAEGTLLLERQS